MSMSQISARSETDALSPAARKTVVSMFTMIGAAALFVCVCWLAQTMVFAGSDEKSATVAWTLMASGVAGFGSALLFATRWFASK